MNERWVKTPYWMSVLFVAALLAATFPHQAAADGNDPPDRAARLNYLQGSVSFEPAGESDWVPAVVNRPMTTGDALWADDGARAEMHLGSATIRLDSRTGLSFLNLDDTGTQILLSQGTINIRVRRLDPDEYFEVDTPNQAFSILEAGQYRVEASEDGNSTLVTVRDGNGEVTGGGRTYSIAYGLSGNFTGTDSLRADIYAANDFDEFDNWSRDRDRHDDQSLSARYVSRDVVGYEDLDGYGSWRPDPDYGNVWVPRVSTDWAPYRDGHWAWISPWGWTWVDDEPWGYAPFHYGRWVYARNNWCWVPGPIAVRPVYAPALVVFVGGPSFGLSLSIGGGRGGGNVGWFPLGPREVYVPSYNASPEYVSRVNVSNTTVTNTTVINVYNNQVTNENRGNNRNNAEIRYANRAAPGAVTVVSQTTFTSARPVERARVSVNQRDIESAPISRRAEVAPTRSSVLGTSVPMGSRVPQPSAAVVDRSVVAKRPPPPPPVPFERQQQKLAAQPGQPLPRNEIESMRPANVPAVQPHVRQAPPGRPATADSNQPARQPGNVPPSNPPPANVGANPPANNPPPVRNGQSNGANRSQPGNVPPSNPPPANVGANPPANSPPPVRNGQSNGANRNQPGNVPPPNPPPANIGGNPPANAAPPVRNGQSNGANRNQPGNVPPPNPPPANVGANPPVNSPPPARNDQSNGANRNQPGNVPPPNPPPANIGGNPPANAAPPVRNGQSNGANRNQPGNVPPPNPPPANIGGNPPANVAPPVRNGQSNGANRNQPGNVPPPNPPPANVGANPPANNAPAVTNERPNVGNRGGPGNTPPPPPPKVSGNPPPKNPPPPTADGKKAQNKKKNQDNQDNQPPSH